MKRRWSIQIDGDYIEYDLIANRKDAYPQLAPKLRYLGFGICPLGDYVHAFEFIDLEERAQHYNRLEKFSSIIK